MSRKPLNFGIGCCFSRCRNSVDNISPTRSYRLAIEETHERAGKMGWTMGLDSDGQAHNLCPEHAGSLFCESPMAGMFNRRQAQAVQLRSN
jgi:hypothetical protein